MIATSSYALYWAGREVFHFVHPWWARVLVVVGAAGMFFAVVVIQEVLEHRKREARRAARAETSARIARLSPAAQRELVRRLRTPPTRPVESGCASWIPEGFEPKKKYS